MKNLERPEASDPGNNNNEHEYDNILSDKIQALVYCKHGLTAALSGLRTLSHKDWSTAHKSEIQQIIAILLGVVR